MLVGRKHSKPDVIWECSEGQWRGIDSIQPCPVFLPGWEIDLTEAGRGILRGPTQSLVESGADFVIGLNFKCFPDISPQKVAWVRALIIDPQPPPKFQHGPLHMSHKETQDKETPRIPCHHGRLADYMRRGE